VRIKCNRKCIARNNTWGFKNLSFEVFGEEPSTSRFKMGLFILLNKDVGLAEIMRESCLFVQNREAYMTLILRNVRVSA